MKAPHEVWVHNVTGGDPRSFLRPGQRALLNGFDACNMESGIDLQGPGKLDMDHHRIDLGHQKWTNKPGSQFVRLDSQGCRSRVGSQTLCRARYVGAGSRHGRPPEALFDNKHGPLDSGVT